MVAYRTCNVHLDMRGQPRPTGQGHLVFGSVNGSDRCLSYKNEGPGSPGPFSLAPRFALVLEDRRETRLLQAVPEMLYPEL